MQGLQLSIAIIALLANLGVDDAGTYRFVYTDPNTCMNTSNNVVISAEASDNLFVYPNPNTGTFYVRYFNASNEKATLNVYNPLGQRVYSREFPTALPYSQLNVVLPALHAAGIYTVEVVNASGVRVGAKSLLIGQ